jgi:hypothetical protein
MTDLRALADEAVHHLDRLGAVILDDVGDGPPAAELAAAAGAAREAVARLAVPALTQLTGLVAGVADALAGGGTEWTTSLGGTLMAAVDDVRHVIGRAAPFSDEDTEHLSNRAAELSPFAKMVSANAGSTPAAQPSREPAPAIATPSAPTRTPADEAAPIVPIASLFYADKGPHIVSGGVPQAAADKSDLLSKGIDALDNLTVKPLASPVSVGATEVVPVETLIYRGRAALERAAALREQIKSSGGIASPAMLDEMYDLIGLALKD